MNVTERLNTALDGRYKIEKQLGQGGMATVYLAKDIKHDRMVAVKVLKPELAAVLGAERFVVEIKTTASLQHPHILPLFDSGTADGFLYYVMPYIEGETLRGKLNRETQFSVDEAVRITTQVADALDYAHRHGVIHRDIKPENILLHDGRPMVADFGIALAVSAAAGGRMTETGLSLGTPHYMSPEQATAEKEITGRSDIYSLASVMYEMLAGQPPHMGGSAQQIIMKIIAEQAQPVTAMRKSVPPHVAAALAKALEKLPADRFESAKAFADALGNATFSTNAVSGHGSRVTGHSSSVFGLPFTIAVTIAVLSTSVAVWNALKPSTSSVSSSERVQVTYSGRASSPAISPDGRFVAYVETRCPIAPAIGGCANLLVSEVGTTRPVEIISGADRLTTPRWTYDGLSLVISGALGAGRTGLFTVARFGGTPRKFAEEPAAYDAHPSADSVVVVFATDSAATMRVVARETGQGSAAIPLAFQPLDIAWSPDARMIAASNYDEVSILGRDGKTLSHRTRTGQRATMRWSADGRSVLTFRWTPGEEDDLVAFPVSQSGEIGEWHLLASRLATLLRGRFDVSRTGRIVIGSGAVFSDIWSFDYAGGQVRRRRETQGTNWYGPPIITADGKTLYYLRADAIGNSMYRLADGRETAVTAERQMVNSSVRFSLDQRTITFESMVDSSSVLMVHDVASGSSRQIPKGPDDNGWLLPGNAGILWSGPGLRDFWITDTLGGKRRTVATGINGVQADKKLDELIFGGFWFLAPDGKSVLAVQRSRDEYTLSRVVLSSGTHTVVKHFPASEGRIGIGAWSADGTVVIARANAASGGVTLLLLNVGTGATTPLAELPVACEPSGLSVAIAARRAACIVRDERADVTLLDGIRP